MATRLINALRQENMNNMRTTTTRSAPISSASVRLSMDISTKEAGRKIVVSTLTPFSPGSISFSAVLDVLGHLERVGVRQLLDDEEQTGSAVDDRVADQWLMVELHGRDVAERELAPVGGGRAADRHRGQIRRRADGEPVLDVELLIGGVDESTGPDEAAVGEPQQSRVERIGGVGHHPLERRRCRR